MRLTPVVLALAVLTACSSDHSSSKIKGVKTYGNLSHELTRKALHYPQSPPVGGAHSPAWIKCGIYSQELPKENAVSSEEHGAVWLTYRRDLSAAKVRQLVALARTNSEFVLVSPYSGQSSPVVATTWGRQLGVSNPSDARLPAFIEAYAGGDQGGTKAVGCLTTGATLAQIKVFRRAHR